MFEFFSNSEGSSNSALWHPWGGSADFTLSLNDGKMYLLTLLYSHTPLEHRPSAFSSIGGGFWLELVVRQMMFSRIPPK
jgi:hypothetical protein